MQHTSRKGPRAACSQPSWFERDDLHLRDERVERPSFVGVGQKSSCIVSYTAAAAPRRRAFFMGRVLRDFAVVKKRLCGPPSRCRRDACPPRAGLASAPRTHTRCPSSRRSSPVRHAPPPPARAKSVLRGHVEARGDQLILRVTRRAFQCTVLC